MLNLQHNIVSILYAVKGMSEAHLTQVNEGRFIKKEERILHAEEILKRICSQAEKALEATRRIGLALKAKEDKAHSVASVKEAWQKVECLLRQEFPMESIEIIERIPGEFPLVRCDADELQEILYHLCGNSIQAMRMQGKLIIRAQLSLTPKEESLATITLSDTGPGISTEKLEHLFHPFFTTKSPDQGNGLGLYLTRELVAKNLGKITVSSFQEYGTTFAIEFPTI